MHLARLLDWEDAHAGFDTAVKDVSPALRGRAPPGLPYSLWQLVEHIRLTQADILEFCRSTEYSEKTWPDDYWPDDAEPPSTMAWDETLRAFVHDREAMIALTLDPKVDLLATIPHGTGQTYLREVLLAADHTAHHVGELIVIRRLLGIWPSA
jgi:hypothetical protein